MIKSYCGGIGGNPSALSNVIQIPSNLYFGKKYVYLASHCATLKQREEQLVRHISLPCDVSQC